MMKLIDSLLDRLTMYRLLLYYLIGLLVVAVLLSLLGVLHYNPLAIIFGSLFLFVVCWASNLMFAYAFDAPSNSDSAFITALILALIISPENTPRHVLFLAAVAGLAIASKYMLAIKRQHIFNPAAIAVILTSLAAGDTASWWVGSSAMLPFVLIGGILLVRKIRSTRMVVAFFCSALISTGLYSLLERTNAWVNIQNLILSSALFFLGFVMLTEPFTAPSTKGKQAWYGIVVGVLFPPQFRIASLYTTPEIALCIGNAFTFIVNPWFKLFPHFQKKVQVTPTTYDFLFTTDKPFDFEPGQYVEWTMPHNDHDSRGVRRFLTIASSPTEQYLRLGVKFYPNGSSFKRTMIEMTSDTPFVGSRLGGDFTMPRDTTRKLALIAGGIGITPYRSMIKYLVDTGKARPIVVLYAASSAHEFAYTDVFETARKRLGIKTVYTITQPVQNVINSPYVDYGKLDQEMVKKHIPDYAERLFYISGPHEMVVKTRSLLKSMGIHSRHIKTDFFSGLAS